MSGEGRPADSATGPQVEPDRALLLRQLAAAQTDQVSVPPAASRQDLDREIDRARRTNGKLVLACVEVVGLKRARDDAGHRADESALLRVVGAIQSRVRSYDLIVRLGGDAFLCAMGGATIQDAVLRFDAVQTALAEHPDPCHIRVGVVALTPEDSAAELVRRAVAELSSIP